MRIGRLTTAVAVLLICFAGVKPAINKPASKPTVATPYLTISGNNPVISNVRTPTGWVGANCYSTCVFNDPDLIPRGDCPSVGADDVGCAYVSLGPGPDAATKSTAKGASTPQGGADVRIYYLTTTDYETWTVGNSGNAVLAGGSNVSDFDYWGTETPSVIKVGSGAGAYRMCYTYYYAPPATTLYALACAFSTDGFTWTKTGPLTTLNAAVNSGSPAPCGTANVYGCLGRAEPSLVYNSADTGHEIWLFFTDVHCRQASCATVAGQPLAQRGISLAKVSSSTWTANVDPAFTFYDGDSVTAGDQPILNQDVGPEQDDFNPLFGWDGFSSPNVIKDSDGWLMVVSDFIEEGTPVRFRQRQITLLESTDGINWNVNRGNLVSAITTRQISSESEVRSASILSDNGTLRVLFASNSDTPVNGGTPLHIGINYGYAQRPPRAIGPSIAVVCPSPWDYGPSTNFVLEPDQSCYSSSLKRWSRTRVASVPHATSAIIVGDDEGETLTMSPNVPPRTNSCFGLDYTGGVISGAHQAAWMSDVNTKATAVSNTPLMTFGRSRPDLAFRNNIATSATGTNSAFSADWVLRTPTNRLVNFESWIQVGSGRSDDATRCANGCGWSDCRDFNYVYNALDLSIDLGGSAVLGSCLNTESTYTLRKILNDKEAGLSAKYASYWFARTPTATGYGSQSMYGPLTAMADMSSDAYLDWYVQFRYEDAIVGKGYYGISLDLPKYWFFWNTTSHTRVKNWADIGDGYGGIINSLKAAESNGNDAYFTGPLRTKAGTAFEYPEYVAGFLSLARKLNNHVPPIPYAINTNQWYYVGCTGPIDSNYDAPGCNNAYDDPTSTANEAREIREIIQRATVVHVDAQGNSPARQEEVRGFIANSTSGHVPTVVGKHDSTKGRATPPAACSNPGETSTNPGTPLP